MPSSDSEALLAAIRKEWHEFRQQLNDEVAKQFQSQERLLLAILQNAHQGCAAGSSSEGLANAGPRASPPQTSASSARNAADVGAKESQPSDKSPEAALQIPTVVADLLSASVEQMLQAALVPLEKSVQRVEAVVTRRSATSMSTTPTTASAATGLEEQQASAGPSASDSTRPTLSNRGSRLEINEVDSEDDTSSRAESHYQEMFENSLIWAHERSVLRRAMYRRCSGVVDWWTQLQEPKRSGWLAYIVNGKAFETLCASVIILNAGVSWYAVNNEVDAMHDGDIYFEPSVFVSNIEIFFVSFYTVELVLKLYVHRLFYFVNSEMQWNIFDAVLVVFALMDQIITKILMDSGNTNMTFMRTLRILKMARILRGLRVMRFFYELRLMLNSLIGSLSSLFWSIVMLLLIYYVFALVFVQGVSNHLADRGHHGGLDRASEAIENLMFHFGQVENAVLALYQASTGGDDWHVFYATILQTGEAYAAVFIFFIAFSQIALLNILTAIFVQRAMKLVQPDRETQALEQRSTEIAEFEELRQIMHLVDVRGTGTVNIRDFTKQIKRGKLSAQLSILGLNIKDAPLFFSLVASRFDADEVYIDEFIEGCMRMRGHASAIEVQHLSCQINGVQALQRELQKSVMDRLALLTERMESAPMHGNAEIDEEASREETQTM